MTPQEIAHKLAMIRALSAAELIGWHRLVTGSAPFCRAPFTARDRGTAPARPAVGRDLDLIIERRALMLHNRSRKAAAAYRRVHTILERGRA